MTKLNFFVERFRDLLLAWWCLLLPTMILCLFPWGSYGWFDLFSLEFFSPKWLDRGLMGGTDITFVYVVAVLVNFVVIQGYADDKTTNNHRITMMLDSSCLLIYFLYYYYTMEVSSNLVMYIIAVIVVFVINSQFKYRCEHCNSLVVMEKINVQHGKVESEVFETHGSNDYFVKSSGSITDSDGHQRVIDREYYTSTMVTNKRKNTIQYRCPCCGYTFSKTETEDLGTQHSRRTKGNERITTTTKLE